MASEPSTSTQVDYFHAIPEEVLLQVLKNLPSSDLLRSRLISQRFKRIHKSNAHRLARPKIDQLTFHIRNSTPTHQLGRLRMPDANSTPCSKQKLCILLKKRSKKSSSDSLSTVRSHEIPLAESEYENSPRFLKVLQETMREFSVNESLNFDGCVVDPKMIEQLTKPYSDISLVKSLSFVLSDLCVSDQEVGELISKTSCSNLSVEFCKGAEKVLTDKLFSHIQDLRSVNLQIRDHTSRLLELTDETLLRWATKKVLPHTIEMREIRTGFTLLGILALIGELKRRFDQNLIDSEISWDLGSISVNVVHFMQFLMIQGLFFNIQNVAPNLMRVSMDLAQQAPLLMFNQNQSFYGQNAFVFPRSEKKSCKISFMLSLEASKI